MAIITQDIQPRYALYNADNMEVLPGLKSDSIGFSVYSPPFPEMYQYSNDPRDMSNCKTYQEGIDQYQFIVNEIHRATQSGRLTAVHCMDLKKGTMYQNDFPGDIIRAHQAAGFNFFCRVTIWKDPWLIARRTRMRGLMHKMIVQDSSKCRVAGPDYVLVFRKGGECKQPIEHPNGFKSYYGEKKVPEHLKIEFANFTGDQRKNRLSHWIWRRYASPVWDDIRTGRLMPYKEARETDEEKHVCPLQMDVIDRCLALWSNLGDIVLTPFLGVGSEAYCALKMGRRSIGIELKETYYRQACRNVQSAITGTDDDSQLDMTLKCEEYNPETDEEDFSEDDEAQPE